MEKKLIRWNHILIGILVLAQPFIIMFQSMIVRDVQLFGLSVFEGFNIILSVISLGITVYTGENKKRFIKYIPYVLLLGTYLILHGYNIYQFNNSVYPAQSPSFLVESYYIFRTFLVPLLLMFNVCYAGIEKEKVLRIFEGFLFVFVSVMVVTNFFKVALINYEEVLLHYLKELRRISFFDWFTFENAFSYSYYELTTKGWFLSGNELSAVLFMSLPLVVYRAYKCKDVFHYVLIVLQMLAMYMLGTKVANMGALLILIMFIGIWCVFAILRHKKQSIIPIMALLIIFGAIFPFSPIGYKYRYEFVSGDGGSESSGMLLDQAAVVNLDEKDEFSEEMIHYYENLIKDSRYLKGLNPNELNEEEKQFIKEYMMNYCGYFGIDPYIIRNYDDLEHSAFWVRYLQETPNNDYRVLKTMILEDIYNNNDNEKDKYLGMGYTTNYIYTEADYTYQFYMYGIIGIVLFIGPYIAMLLFVIIKGLLNIRKIFNLSTAICFVAPLIGILVAKLSGHVLERTLPLMTIAMLSGILYLHVEELTDKKETNPL